MTRPAARTARRTGRFDVAPDEGTVEVRLRGTPDDIAAFAALLTAMTGATVRHNRDRSYGDRNGVTVRHYMTADMRKDQP